MRLGIPSYPPFRIIGEDDNLLESYPSSFWVAELRALLDSEHSLRQAYNLRGSNCERCAARGLAKNAIFAEQFGRGEAPANSRGVGEIVKRLFSGGEATDC